MDTAGQPPAPPSASGPSFKYPERFSEATLAAELSNRLVGRPASGVAPAPPAAGRIPTVVWVDAGSDVLVHLDSIRTRLTSGSLMVSVDLESDQTGRASIVVVFGMGATNDPAGLLAVTDETPRGRGILVGRWGAIVRDAIWAALLAMIADFATERQETPSGFAAEGGFLQLLASPASLLTPGAPK